MHRYVNLIQAWCEGDSIHSKNNPPTRIPNVVPNSLKWKLGPNVSALAVFCGRGSQRGTASQYRSNASPNLFLKKLSSWATILRYGRPKTMKYTGTKISASERTTKPRPMRKLARYIGFRAQAYGPPVVSDGALIVRERVCRPG